MFSCLLCLTCQQHLTTDDSFFLNAFWWDTWFFSGISDQFFSGSFSCPIICWYSQSSKITLFSMFCLGPVIHIYGFNVYLNFYNSLVDVFTPNFSPNFICNKMIRLLLLQGSLSQFINTICLLTQLRNQRSSLTPSSFPLSDPIYFKVLSVLPTDDSSNLFTYVPLYSWNPNQNYYLSGLNLWNDLLTRSCSPLFTTL